MDCHTPQHPPLPGGSSLGDGQGQLKQLCALAAPIAHLGVCWREGGALLAVLYPDGNRIG